MTAGLGVSRGRVFGASVLRTTNRAKPKMLIERFYTQIVRRIIAPRQLVRTFGADNSGAAIVVIALALPLLIGAIGLAAEVSYWQLHHRAMQNAADAAAIAAATNNSSNYSAEGIAVASQYGFPNGQGQITVVLSNPSTALGCTTNCYVATISDNVPMYFSQIVGYQGSAEGSQHATTITATSVASSQAAYSYCVLALASSGAEGITSHGAPNANLNGCNTMSDSSATCTGHNLNASIGDAVGTNSGCGIQQHSNVAPQSDQFAQLATNIPPNTCTSYAKETLKTGPSSLPAANQLSGLDPPGSYQVINSTGNYQVFCGDVGLTSNTTINNTILVIENGLLDTGGYTLQGSGLTIIFTGTNTGNYNHYPTNGGTLDIAAPTSDTWSGVAIYQDPSLTKNVDISAAGNSPTWNISGLVYLPHSSVTLSGAVNKSGTGASCFEMVVDNLTINGTGDIFANDTQCPAAGLNQTRGGNRGTLVD